MLRLASRLSSSSSVVRLGSHSAPGNAGRKITQAEIDASPYFEGPANPLGKTHVKLTFVAMNGSRFVVEKAPIGQNLLQIIKDHDVPLPAPCDGGSGKIELWNEGPQCLGCIVYVSDSHINTMQTSKRADELVELAQKKCLIESTQK